MLRFALLRLSNFWTGPMLYTAITLGIETVVLVGVIDLINEIIAAAP
jgi:hypothetical protein